MTSHHSTAHQKRDRRIIQTMHELIIKEVLKLSTNLGLYTIFYGILLISSMTLQASPAEYPYFLLFTPAMLLQSSLEEAPRRNPAPELQIRMQPRNSERQNYDFDEEMQEKVCRPRYRLGDRRQDLPIR